MHRAHLRIGDQALRGGAIELGARAIALGGGEAEARNHAALELHAREGERGIGDRTFRLGALDARARARRLGFHLLGLAMRDHELGAHELAFRLGFGHARAVDLGGELGQQIACIDPRVEIDGDPRDTAGDLAADLDRAARGDGAGRIHLLGDHARLDPRGDVVETRGAGAEHREAGQAGDPQSRDEQRPATPCGAARRRRTRRLGRRSRCHRPASLPTPAAMRNRPAVN